MEYICKIGGEKLSTAIGKALALGYKFLPHDRVVSATSESERICFLTLPDPILPRIALRRGRDWFHLVRNNWHYYEYSTTLVLNRYQGEMEVVDQRSWGPYIDFQVRRRTSSGKTDEFELNLHLYPRFWEPRLKVDLRTPDEVKKDFSALRSAITPSRRTNDVADRKARNRRRT